MAPALTKERITQIVSNDIAAVAMDFGLVLDFMRVGAKVELQRNERQQKRTEDGLGAVGA